MITKIELRPVTGSALEINTAVYPVHGWEPEIDLPTNEIKKMQRTGLWPTFAYPGAMKIPLEGAILGNGATDALRASDVMAKRRALNDACLPPLDQPLTTRKHGVLRVRYEDMTEDADADFHCIMFRAPLKGPQGANIPFFINFLCFTPYFVGVGTQAIYLP